MLVGLTHAQEFDHECFESFIKFFGHKTKHNIFTHSPNLMSGDIKRNKMCLSHWEAYILAENQQRPKHSGAEGLA